MKEAKYEHNVWNRIRSNMWSDSLLTHHCLQETKQNDRTDDERMM